MNKKQLRNKLFDISKDIYTEEFLALLYNMPDELRNDKRISKLVKEIGKQINNKPIVDCVVALSHCLLTTLLSNEKNFKSFINDLKTDINYIQ